MVPSKPDVVAVVVRYGEFKDLVVQVACPGCRSRVGLLDSIVSIPPLTVVPGKLWAHSYGFPSNLFRSRRMPSV